MPNDLTEKLAETLVWTHLRILLGTRLQEQADAGSQAASEQLTFLARHWPTGGVPRQQETVLTERLRQLVVKLLEQMDMANVRWMDSFVLDAIELGAPVPEHFKENLK